MAEADTSLMEVFKQAIASPRRRSTAGSPWNSQWPAGFDKNMQLVRPGAWAAEAARMVLTDPKLMDLSHQTRTAMLQGTWVVKAAKPHDEALVEEAERNAAFIRRAFGLEGYLTEARRSWEAMLGQMARWAEVGFRVMETVYEYRDGNVWLRDLYDIEPASIVGWVRDHNSEILAVEQDSSRTGTGRYRTMIPVDRTLLILTNGETGDIVTGQGMLRACWFWWKLKELLGKQLGIAAEKWGLPTLVATCDTVAMRSNFAAPEVEKVISDVQANCESYASNEAAWLIELPGIVYRVLAQGAFAPDVFRSAIAVCDEQMASAWSAAFKAIGMSGEGSRAIGEVHYDAWKVAVANRMDYIAASMRKVVVDLLEINFYQDGIPAAVIPHFAHRGMEVDGLSDGLGSLTSLCEADIVTKTPELEHRILELMGVPAGEGTNRTYAERKPASGYVAPADASGGEGRPQGS